ncbi:MAG: TonB-dependent receptor [Tenacibaculum sp.]|nr:TonB-dependent receptor [Tenacibaculum sp.]
MKTKFKGFLTLLLALMVQVTFAQDKTISGTVSDEAGPLPGVSILKKGTTQGTETDFDGNYTIKAKTGDVLIFSFVGMETVEKKVGNSTSINVTMENDNVLKEVVVTGYSNKDRDVLTSGVSTVTAKELAQVNSTVNVTNALQGKAAGVVVTAANGKPGQNAFVRIRGIGSVNAGQEPLYVIDGMPVSESQLNLINSSDIESISVLKDAASTSAYGSRGSNGVVVITTKKGKKGERARITFSSQVGFSKKIEDNFDMMNAEQKIQYEKEVGRGGYVSGYGITDEGIKTLLKNNHDWQKDLLKTGMLISNGISINGGIGNTGYFVSFKTESDTGIIKRLDGYKRMTGRVNLNSQLNDWLKIRVNTGVSHTYSQEPRDRNNVQNPFRAMYSYNPFETLYKRDKDNNVILDTNGNPIYNKTSMGFSIAEALVNNPESEERLRLIGGVALDFNIYKEKLIFTPQISMIYSTLRGEYYTQPGSILDGYVGDKKAPGSKRDNGNYFFSYNYLNKLSYKDTFNDVHNFGASLFTEFYNNNYRSYRIKSKGFPSKDLTTQDNASASDGKQSTYRREKALFSIGASVDYDYDKKYIASLSLRRDGSSVFGDKNRYGIFWSASAAWNIHKESFFKSKVFNKLKLRASYGTVGNDKLPNYYGYMGTYEFSSYNGASAAYPANVANSQLKWEQKAMTDLGVEFGLFNGRLNGVVNYFNSKTSDLLFLENIAQESGESGWPASRYTNFGTLSSRGLEIELNGDVIKTEDFTWNLGANISFIKTKMDKLPGGEDYLPSGYDLILQEGEEIYTHYLVRYAGVNPENGRAQYYDKDGKVTEEYSSDFAVPLKGKTITPDFDGSFNTLFSFRGISLSGNFYFKYGNYIYNNQEATMLTDGNDMSGNSRADALNYWKKKGDRNVLPNPKDPKNTEQTSDRFLQDGSYIRLRSLKLSYDLPKKFLGEKGFFTSVNMYLQGQNLWTYRPHFKGDPEVGIGSGETKGPTDVGFVPGAYNLFSYPTTKSFVIGLNVSF